MELTDYHVIIGEELHKVRSFVVMLFKITFCGFVLPLSYVSRSICLKNVHPNRSCL